MAIPQTLGEFDLIRRYFVRSPKNSAATLLGVGDDCALLSRLDEGQQWAISTDMLVQGRHFFADVDAQSLGHKALAVNLSDMAACGAKPQAFTLALALPALDPVWLEGFSRGLFELADAHGCDLVGGDTTRGPLTLSITIMGSVPAQQALLRSGAKVGDDLYVSGCLGDARLALAHLCGEVALAPAALAQVRTALEWPQPRVALGQALRGVASSCLDLSDGLMGDLGHLLQQSQVGAQLWLAQIPRSQTLVQQPVEVQRQCLLSGGDDYELLFTAPAARREHIQALAVALQTPLTRVGLMTPSQEGVKLWDEQGQLLSSSPSVSSSPYSSFDHFKT